jgi:hypothetical protein
MTGKQGRSPLYLDPQGEGPDMPPNGGVDGTDVSSH